MARGVRWRHSLGLPAVEQLSSYAVNVVALVSAALSCLCVLIVAAFVLREQISVRMTVSVCD